jgi:hypothetical protein
LVGEEYTFGQNKSRCEIDERAQEVFFELNRGKSTHLIKFIGLY